MKRVVSLISRPRLISALVSLWFAGTAAAAPPVTVSISPTSATVRTGETQQFTATVRRANNTGVTWTASAGSITATGLYTAPATVPAGTVTVKATSVADPSKSASATVTVIQAPVIVPLTVATASLPAGIAGAGYAAHLSATGGTPPYRWTVAIGQLPPGLTLSSGGTFFGTPTANGTYAVAFQVRDTATPSQTLTTGYMNLTIAAVAAAHYYVDPAGNDNNAGTSEAAPWQTLAKVHATILQPGDTVHFKRGGTWQGPLVAKQSGSPGLPITYTDYGSAGDAKPVILGIPTAESYRAAVEIDQKWVVVENFFLQSGHEAGVRIGGWKVWYAQGADHNMVRNCEITQSGTGVTAAGEYNLITGNYAHDLTMIVNDPGGDNDYGAVGYWLFGPSNEVSYNRCSNCKASSYDYRTDGGAFEIYHNGDNSYIHHNWAENSNGFLEAGGGSLQRTAKNVLLAYNVSYNNGGLACLHTGGTFSLEVRNFRVEHNTVVQTSGGQLFGCMSTFTPDTMSLRNNIFYTSGSVFSNGNFTHENNLYGGGTKVGYSTNSTEIRADPQFVNVSGKNFRLQSTSPAKDRGAALGYTVDFDGVPVPQGPAPDIGAYEYKAP